MTDKNVHPDSPIVLVASPVSEDRRRLTDILGISGLLPGIENAHSVRSAIAVVHRMPVAVAMVERDFPDGTWHKLLDAFQSIRKRPLLIVTSSQADDYLWAEALNLGAFDVLAKPFDAAEVTRVVTWACLRWCEINPKDGGSESFRKKCASAVAQTASGHSGRSHRCVCGSTLNR